MPFPIDAASLDLLLQAAPVVNDVDVTVGVGGGAVGSVLSTLVVGAILVTLAPEYTGGTMDALVEDPVGSFVSGLLVLVGLLVVTFVLAITVVGLVVAVPLLFVAWVLWAVGATVGFLAVADRFVGREDGWLKPLALAAGVNGLLALTGVGGLASFLVGAAGFGAVLRDWL